MKTLLRTLLAASAWLSRQTALFVAIGGAVAFLRPRSFSWVHGDTQTAILGVIMLAMGLTLSKKDFVILARRPFDMAVGAVAQYLIMPLLAWGIARTLHLSPALATGLILVGCCPGGVSSNIMAFLCRGDVAFSVGMTTVSTLLAPVMTPLLMLHLAGETVDVNAWGMFQSILLVTILPVGLGLLLNTLAGRTRAFAVVLGLMPGLAVIGLACIVGGVIASNGQAFFKSGAVLFLAVLLHNFGGYVLGYLAGRAVGMNPAKKRTLSIEVGMQNAGLATVLATKHFPALPDAAVISAVSCVWHSLSGAVLAGLFLHFEKKHH